MGDATHPVAPLEPACNSWIPARSLASSAWAAVAPRRGWPPTRGCRGRHGCRPARGGQVGPLRPSGRRHRGTGSPRRLLQVARTKASVTDRPRPRRCGGWRGLADAEGGSEAGSHGRRSTLVRDLPVSGRRPGLRWRTRLWRCHRRASTKPGTIQLIADRRARPSRGKLIHALRSHRIRLSCVERMAPCQATRN